MEQMTFLDFFAGIGGFRKGFELCGMRCVGHCEIDKYADRSYRAIHDVKEDEWYAADITKVAPADLPRADLWAGGFPCQDISVAGRQRGLDGARSGLFFTLAQLVKGQSPENRPTWIVLENVKNLLSIHGGWDFATVLDTLASLGYHIEYGLLNSRFPGVPQTAQYKVFRPPSKSRASVHCRLPTSWSRTRTQNISCPRRQWQSSYPTHRRYAGAARLRPGRHQRDNGRTVRRLGRKDWAVFR